MEVKMSNQPRVFISDAMEGLSERAGRDLLSPLRARADCEIWSLARRPDRGELEAALGAADGWLCMLTDPVDEALMAACPQLRVVSSFSVGIDHIDLAAATRRGILVGNTPGVLTETTADLAFALLLAAARRMGEAGAYLRTGAWAESQWEIDAFVGQDLHGATLGIVGLGPIGQAVARRAAGFGMEVLGWSRSGRAVPGVRAVAFDALLAESDFVSLHVALVAETRGLMDARALAAMKPGAVLVNTARGGIVDEEALVDALRSGQLGAVGLDVYAQEPLSADHPLLAFPNAVLMPHIGSASVRTRVRMADLAVENLVAGLEGRALPECANPAAREAAP
jgi:glyoxylate reductase